MNILGLFLNQEIRTGGHRRYLDLMERLAALGHQVTVVLNTSLDFSPSHFHPIRHSIPYKHGGFPPVSLLFRRAVGSVLNGVLAERGSVDVIVVFGETHLSAAVFLKRRLCAALLYAHRNNIVREGLISLRENRCRPAKLLRVVWDLCKARRYERLITRTADAIVFQSHYDLEDFASREPKVMPRAYVIRGDIRGPRFRPEQADTNRSRSMRRILFIGTFGERKGVKYLIRAAKIMATAGISDVSFDIAGPGEKRTYWESYIRSVGLSGTVNFYGRIADPLGMMSAADLVVIPSLFDSYPNVILEALHVGTAVVGSSVGGIPDMLQHPELLFPPADAQAIADRLILLHDDAAAFKRVQTLCRQRRTYFDFDWAGEFERVLLQITGIPA
jgi:glycosyltransferase involved in cell wall biosynthesis